MPLRLRQIRQARDGQVERRVGEAVADVDHQAAGPRLAQLGHGVAVDLAGSGLRRVARHAREAVALLAVDLGLCQRAGDGAGVGLGEVLEATSAAAISASSSAAAISRRVHRPFLSPNVLPVMKLTPQSENPVGRLPATLRHDLIGSSGRSRVAQPRLRTIAAVDDASTKRPPSPSMHDGREATLPSVGRDLDLGAGRPQQASRQDQAQRLGRIAAARASRAPLA